MTKTCLSAYDYPLIPIPIPMHPNMPQVLGYSGSAKRVAFFWGPGGYEGFSHDGKILTNTIDREAFGKCLRHPRVARVLQEYSLMPNEEEKEAQYWLVLDRKEGRPYIAPPNAALAFLQEQYPPRSSSPVCIVASLEELQRLANQALQQAHYGNPKTQQLSLVELQSIQIVQDTMRQQFLEWLKTL